ncbi:trifunctional serine/threonine-protein kinase/ATP-binding protein/sensor histidine kinase [Microcoleus vaginatus]|uniref:trifunctional serine/threonine-protein kinase/ATP-binding protein/sensor histidine kinase n=1 Tax=Microcoleus vaginatus TaxID=119532 RepID=UPI001F5FFB7E|nr:GAF domain-containing protein [Microcoleus vaginatus HSN003]
MQFLSQYQIHSTLHEGIETIIYRGQIPSHQDTTVLKILKAEYPTLDAITRIKHEYRIRQHLDHPGLVKVISLETFDNRLGLLLEDFEGESLDRLMSRQKLEVITCLRFGIQLIKTLEYLHLQKIIHKDIKPSNIIINSQTGIIKLTDFGIASRLTKENPQINNINSLVGTFAYMSPEQTGRMNRTLDYRTDFYSLGITLYEMLTGQLPFMSNDPLEIVYSHIASQAIVPHQINSEIPPAISQIVMKLMAKNAEQRYQSAGGLLADLEICLNHLETTGQIVDFTPGNLDILSQLLIPQKLYGRETQVSQLLAAFERVANPCEEISSPSQIELILVSGYAGIGKSAVVSEIQKPITRQRGYFISGKFDQFKRNIPYASLIQAFQSLIQQLLAENSKKIQDWQHQLLAALGNAGQVIIDVIPELELVIGKQPAVPELAPTEAQNRFNRLFKEFIHVFAQKEHPLVIFLDDLQWSDSATLKLMELLATDPDSKYLLLIGAYRDREVSSTHPLMQTVEYLEQTGTLINKFVLQPLSLAQVTELISETLNDSERIHPLAELIWNKTGGNPFFVTQLLNTLYQEQLLKFDFSRLLSTGIKGQWQWNIEEIQAIGITDKSVVELVASRIQKLPEITREVLKLAACVGDNFTLDVLSTVNAKSPSVTATELWDALQAGLILPLNESYLIPLFLDRESAVNLNFNSSRVGYKFLHDRVQQAAYSLIPDDEKKATHLSIGKLLLENTPPDKVEERIFDIINQLNVGIDCLTQQSEKDELAELNLIAGHKAKAANAYEPAVKYLNVGISLLAPDSWVANYNMTLRLYVETLEAEYLNTNFEQAEVLAEVVLRSAKDQLDIVKVYQLKILFYQAQSQMLKAVETGLEVLEMLGINLLDQQTIAVPKLPRIEELENLPVMTDPYQLAAMEILTALYPPAYIAKPEIVSSLVLTMVNLCIDRGHSALATFPYTLYGTILCGVEGDIEAGYYAGLIALKLLEQFNATQQKAKVYVMFNGHIRIWKESTKNTLAAFLEGRSFGLESGDLEWAIYNSKHYIANLFLVGEPLDFVKEKQTIYMEFLIKNKHEFAIGYAKIWQIIASSLRSKTAEQVRLVSGRLDEPAVMSRWQKENNRMSLFAAYVAKLMLLYLFKDYAPAVARGKLAAEYADGAIGLITVGVHNFYYSLALLAHYPHSDNQEASLAIVNSNQQLMKKWAYHAPMNYQHKYELVEAEKARVINDKLAAMDYYDLAIKGAAANGYIHEEALAYELAGEFYQSLDKEISARAYLTKAYYAYIRWGATAKVKDLEARYHYLVERHQDAIHKNVISTAQTTMNNSLVLDFSTVLKASQAVSSEIILSRLLEKLVQLVKENAGAQKVLFLAKTGNQLFIEAGLTGQFNDVTVLQSIPIAESDLLPISLINYVERTQKYLVLDDATRADQFQFDPYIATNQPLSILVLPIIHQGNLTGIFYLENNLTKGAFTSDRLEILGILSAQAAISLENARFYSVLETRVAQRTENLHTALEELRHTQLQLIQSEKMSSLGQVVGGIAHEINNPINFIYGNLYYTNEYAENLLNLLRLYQKNYPNPVPEIVNETEEIDLEFLINDFTKMIDSMRVGAARVRDIVLSLRNFSRLDESDRKWVNIHEGMDSTLMILDHKLLNIQVFKEYGNLPLVNCYPGEINQVFMNVLTNAIDAFCRERGSEVDSKQSPTIQICTEVAEGNQVAIRIVDNGVGMNSEVLGKIFDPFFTTKPVGKGTGLGLSISYQIVVEQHGGKLICKSEPGEGSEVSILLPY